MLLGQFYETLLIGRSDGFVAPVKQRLSGSLHYEEAKEEKNYHALSFLVLQMIHNVAI